MNYGNADGGVLPGPIVPQPDYRSPQRDARRYDGLAADAEKDYFHTMLVLHRHFGILAGVSLTECIERLLDEHREYEIRLGIDRRTFMGNPG